MTLEIADEFEASANPLVIPIRHHSPACAWHVLRLLEAERPDALLVEGPTCGQHLIAAMTSPDAKTPLAIFSSVIDEISDEERKSISYFYPFCSHSPEYVAFQWARRRQVESAFVDLPTWWISRYRDGADVRVNGYSDEGLRHEAFLKELCKRSREQDFDAFWDSAFEAGFRDRDSAGFFTPVATFCAASRWLVVPEQMERDGTHVRESHMAARVHEAMKGGRRVAVVAGGFHRLGILEHLRAGTPAPEPPKESAGISSGTYLTIYSQPQFDRWTGYSAGIAGPEFRERHWQSAHESGGDRWTIRLLSDAARWLDQRGLRRPSTADVIATSTMLEGLRRMRGHAEPTLDDLRDSIRSTWIKGDMASSEGEVLSVVEELLRGTRVGAVGPDAGRPPIVEDFYRQVVGLKLVRSTRELVEKGAKQVSLDIYRRPAHRRRSVLLHRLAELGCEYGKFEAGPDFVRGSGLDRVRESWKVRWRPAIESELVECSVLGATIAEAAARHLIERSQPGHALQGSASAVERLTSAFVMDFRDLVGDLFASVTREIEMEGEFDQAARAVAGLVHLLLYRKILQADRYPDMIPLACRAYERAIWLLDTLPGMPVDSSIGEVGGVVVRARDSLLQLRHCATSRPMPGIEEGPLLDQLESIHVKLGDQPMLQGTVAGILRQSGRLSESAYRELLLAAVESTRVNIETALGDYLQGLFAASPRAVTLQADLLESIHACIQSLEEDRFLRALPSLRLAFTSFSPRETQMLVTKIDSLAGLSPPSEPAEERGMKLGPVVDKVVVEQLARLGLPTHSMETA